MLHLESDWTYRSVDLDVESRAACKNDFLFSRKANILRRTRDVILLPLVLVALTDACFVGAELARDSLGRVGNHPFCLRWVFLEVDPCAMYAAIVVTSVSESRIVVMFTALKNPCAAVLIDLIDDGATARIDERSNRDVGPGRDVRRTNGHGLHHRSPERRLALSVVPQSLHRSPPLDQDYEVVLH